MPTSSNRHPTRDALLRDALGQLKEQRGVSNERFARVLNGLAHGMCPLKTAEMPCLSSFTEVTEEYDHAVMSWNKRVQRWATGAVEFPAWLEEPWVSALEELGDERTRTELARRHGYLGVAQSREHRDIACLLRGTGMIQQSSGGATVLMGKIACDGVIDGEDLPYLPEAQRLLLDLAANAMGMAEVLRKAEADLAKA